ncbi:phage/plasmid primase, P4 family [Methylobacterium soli]|uniref:SF3 helicase domain-containing protein n=1 Tax=Methylobacterium soli TaxID=553447 RepID=A0A6L3T504_9HYPH|nr:phage/plasmid primase, P4 family [Methylobacterium soli]KAB1078395.1 hypothetical protein F6X53_15025 [Methylobacterium soli]GJE45811.1 hypothetical protein AEGHOMDF_5011 [Methylobacterium soli]
MSLAINGRSAIDQFVGAMAAEGIEIDGELIADGKLHRYYVKGDRQGSKNGWAILHDDARPAGKFGCNKRFAGHAFTFKADVKIKPMTAAEKKAQKEEWARKKAEREQAEQQRRAVAADRAAFIWAAAKPATDDHPYLVRKGIKAYGIRQGNWEVTNQDTGEIRVVTEQALLVPLMDKSRNIRSLQAILPGKLMGGRDKDYLRDGAKQGLFFPIGKPQTHEGRKVFVVCEGFATGASIYKATGHMVLVAFDSGNLLAVADPLRESQPEAIIIIAADNDQWATGPIANPGLHYARRAAASVRGLVAFPPFAADEEGRPTDFNDLHSRQGAEAVATRFATAIENDYVPAEPELATESETEVAPWDGERLAPANEEIPGYITEVPCASAAESGPSAGAEIIHIEQDIQTRRVVMPIGADARDGINGVAPLTETGNCYRMVIAHGNNIRFVPELEAWLHWSGQKWLWDVDGSVLRGKVRDLATKIYEEGSEHFEQAELFLKWARTSQSAKTIRNVADLLKDVAELRLPLSTIDGNPMLVGIDGASQVLDLRTGLCRPAIREDYITRSLGVAALGDASKATGWKKFIGEVFINDEELIDWVKRFIGYSLTGCYNEQLFIFAHGGGSNGKSVLVKVLKQLSGEYCRTVAATTLMEQKRGAGDASPDVAALAGARLLLASETSAGAAFDEQFLKGWTGGDPQNARKLYKDEFTFEPVGKLFIAGNYRPRISGTDYAIWRRVRLLPFNRTFRDEEKDPHLPEKLLTELPHILAWAAEGCKAWQEKGLTADTPRVMKDASREYAADQDVLGEFLGEHTVVGVIHECSGQELYGEYKMWMVECGLKPVSRQAFGRQLSERGFSKRHTNKGSVYTGLALLSPL